MRCFKRKVQIKNIYVASFMNNNKSYCENDMGKDGKGNPVNPVDKTT